MAVLTAERLSLGYRQRALVQDLSFDLQPGEILGIVGPNGCGKTTLLRVMLGLMPPLGGRIDRDPDAAIAYLRQRDRLDTILPITALEMVMLGRGARFGPFRRTRASDRAMAQRALASVDAENLGPQLFRNLSGGQQQRVLIARALATEPDVLVLDEPTAGMDLASEAAILEFLRDLNRTRGVTIVVVTHMLQLVLNLATTVLLMTAGRVLHGTRQDILREDRLSALYGVSVHLSDVAGQRVLVVDRPGATGV